MPSPLRAFRVYDYDAQRCRAARAAYDADVSLGIRGGRGAMTRCDVVIVGGGFSGAMVAAHLARAGGLRLSVRFFEGNGRRDWTRRWYTERRMPNIF